MCKRHKVFRIPLGGLWAKALEVYSSAWLVIRCFSSPGPPFQGTFIWVAWGSWERLFWRCNAVINHTWAPLLCQASDMNEWSWPGLRMTTVQVRWVTVTDTKPQRLADGRSWAGVCVRHLRRAAATQGLEARSSDLSRGAGWCTFTWTLPDFKCWKITENFSDTVQAKPSTSACLCFSFFRLPLFLFLSHTSRTS